MTIPNFDIAFYEGRISEIDAEIAKLTKERKNLLSDVAAQYKDDIEERYSLKDEPFGAAKIPLGDFEIETNWPKKVDWDQEKLAALYKKISQHESPELYIDVKYTVSETAYKKWPTDVAQAFEPARTVKHGSQTIKIKRAE